MEPEPEQRKRDRLLSSPTGCTPRQGSKRSRSRIPVASPQVCRPTNRSGQHRKSGTSPGSSRIPVAVRSSSTKTEIKPSVVTSTRLSALDRLFLQPRSYSIVRKWSEEEDRALVLFILLGTPGSNWPTLKEYPTHFCL